MFTGFSDGEATFSVSIRENPSKNGIGWQVLFTFQIGLHSRDIIILNRIQAFFGGIGRISFEKKRDVAFYTVTDRDGLKLIIKHFQDYPLQSYKWIDFSLFCQIYELVQKRSHMTKEGLNYIVSIRKCMNLSLSDKLTKAFPNLVLITLPIRPSLVYLDPYWVTGFIDGEGCFSINKKISKNKFMFSFQPIFELTQHERDKSLLEFISQFFCTGNVYLHSNKRAYRFMSSSSSKLCKSFIPHL